MPKNIVNSLFLRRVRLSTSEMKPIEFETRLRFVCFRFDVHRLFTWKLSTFLCPRRYWQCTIVDVIYLLLSIIHCCCRLVERVWLLTYLFGSCYFVVFQLFKTRTGFWGMRLWRRDCLLFDVVILSMSCNNTWKITE